MSNKVNLRCVTVKDVVYIRLEDVAALIMEAGSCEETDVRWRMNELAENMMKASEGVE